MSKNLLSKFVLSDEICKILKNAKNIIIPETRAQLIEMSMGKSKNDLFEVAYDVPEKGNVVEATVAHCSNGLVVNYMDVYMRRRDPDCMIIGDNKDTDKPTFKDRYGKDFEPYRQDTFEWFKGQNLIFMPFMSGGHEYGYPSVLIAPENAAFFAAALADLQGFLSANDITDGFEPKAVVYLAPPFRHTHFNGKQVVVHNRLDNIHEVFSYNLYPGPSAKKGIYGVLLNMGEKEGWVTAHASTVKVTTPYDNEFTIMHEGASGAGKSEMIEQIQREVDGRIMVGRNCLTNEKILMELKENCDLQPVTDDMALCHPKLQNASRKLVVKDAEEGWFLRLDNITHYGSDPHYEKLCIHPKEPLIFFNLKGVPGSTCLIWEHIMDTPDKPCPNPRVIVPRKFVPSVVDEPMEIDIRSFGVRTPPCTKVSPTYGIIGFLHILPPALAWLWRLVAPRGYANPSILDTEGMTSEGVGSYWPFATGKMVDQANLLLKQVVETPSTRYILTPNQYVGVYKVGFMPQWITREYLARRGSARFKPGQLTAARSSILGYALEDLKVDGAYLPKGLLQPNLQPEVGNEGYDGGARVLTNFFKKELKKFLVPELDPTGRAIIECCMNDGSLDEYLNLIPMKI